MVSDFTYELPEVLIATRPPKQRGSSRLLVLHKRSGETAHARYADLADHLEPGDLVVLNDTEVIKARIPATDSNGKDREILLLEEHGDSSAYRRKAMYRGKLRSGEELTVGGDRLRIIKIYDNGTVLVESDSPLLEIARKHGTVPLPPYMHRSATKEDIERYQTVFADKAGSVAAPTASLNFTNDLQQRLTAKGVLIEKLTLHVGLGTFMPIRTDSLEQHTMHSEYFEIPSKTALAINSARRDGRRIVAVGTTVTRTLEYCANELLVRNPSKIAGEADIFIYPGYDFKVVDTMLTNFHAPKSTVLMMTAAFAGWDNLKHAYDKAIKEAYAFLSYGDSMLIT